MVIRKEASPPMESYPQLMYRVPLQYRDSVTITVKTPCIVKKYGPHPQPSYCSNCRKHITTKVISDPTAKTHAAAIALGLLCCVPCVPYCIDSCQNRNHYCPNCSAFLGTYSEKLIGCHCY